MFFPLKIVKILQQKPKWLAIILMGKRNWPFVEPNLKDWIVFYTEKSNRFQSLGKRALGKTNFMSRKCQQF